MKFIFIHPNFPAQFRHTAQFLGKHKGNRVVFVTANPRQDWVIPGVEKRLFREKKQNPNDPSCLPGDFAVAGHRAEAVARVLWNLKKEGFVPDLIMGHSGWGTTLHVKDIFPQVPFLGYFEWYYDPEKPNARFGASGPPGPGIRVELRKKNLTILSDLAACDHGISPTQWQRDQFPEIFHHKLSVAHEGINTDFFRPVPEVKCHINGLDLRDAKEIVTYTTRGFEPYRGFPQFIESIPYILERRPDAHIVIVGQDRVYYGAKLPNGQTYKQLMTQKVDLDPGRVHFLPPLPYGKYRQVLQASSVHVYLTYPFVLSWSLLEAMSCGCLVVASDTPPVRELIKDGVNGILAPFHRPEKIAEKVGACLEYPSFMVKIRKTARQTIVANYALDKMLRQHVSLMTQTMAAAARNKTNLETDTRFG